MQRGMRRNKVMPTLRGKAGTGLGTGHPPHRRLDVCGGAEMRRRKGQRLRTNFFSGSQLAHFVIACAISCRITYTTYRREAGFFNYLLIVSLFATSDLFAAASAVMPRDPLIGLVGKPSAGKSSTLNSLTDASSKVGMSKIYAKEIIV